MTDQVREKMSLEDFMSLPETHTLTELIDGEVFMSPAPKDKHQKACGALYVMLYNMRMLGEVRISPCDVVIDKHETVLQPDVFWVSAANTSCELRDGVWYGAPDLVIEVLSPATASRDRGVKFDRYEANGVREYWIADPDAAFIEAYALKDGTFSRLGLFEVGQAFDSPVLRKQITVRLA